VFVFVGKVFVFVGKVFVFVGKVFAFVGKVHVLAGKVFVLVGKVFILVGKVFVLVGKVFVLVGKVFVLVWKMFVLVGKVSMVVAGWESVETSARLPARTLTRGIRAEWRFVSSRRLGAARGTKAVGDLRMALGAEIFAKSQPFAGTSPDFLAGTANGHEPGQDFEFGGGIGQFGRHPAQFQLLHHNTAQPLEQFRLDRRKLAWMPVNDTDGPQPFAGGRQQGRAGVKPDAGFAGDEGVFSKPVVGAGIFHHHDLGLQNRVGTKGLVARGRGNGEADLGLEPLAVNIHQGDGRHGGFGNVRGDGHDVFEDHLRRGVQNAIAFQSRQPRRFITGNRKCHTRKFTLVWRKLPLGKAVLSRFHSPARRPRRDVIRAG